jgi:anti-sigma28 factor (negative regulator of flagellin synthesis)
MKISKNTFDPIRPTPSSDPAVLRRAQNAASARSGTPVQSDSVSISDAGRRLTAGQAESIDPERVAELRTKVLNGAYNTLDVVEQVSRRILQRGDL